MSKINLSPFSSNSKSTGLPTAELKINGVAREDVVLKIHFELP